MNADNLSKKISKIKVDIKTHFVLRLQTVGVHRLHHNERMKKMGRDHVGQERRVALLKDDSNDVVPDVSFPLQLLSVTLHMRQQRRHVEHDLTLAEFCIKWLESRLAVLDVETGTVAGMREGNEWRFIGSKKIKKKYNDS